MRSRREHLDERVVRMRILPDLDFGEYRCAVAASKQKVQDERPFGACAVIEKLRTARSHDVELTIHKAELEVFFAFDRATLRVGKSLRYVDGSRDCLAMFAHEGRCESSI